MNRTLEVLLTIVALSGLYSAMSNNISRPGSAGVRMQQAVVVADGTDPMPLCRRRNCTQ
jgi:hypothetical protein